MLNDAVSNATVTQCRKLCIKQRSQYKRKNSIQRGRGLIEGVVSPGETEMNGKKCQNSLMSQPVFEKGITQTRSEAQSFYQACRSVSFLVKTDPWMTHFRGEESALKFKK
jgi:hypothetical protein